MATRSLNYAHHRVSVAPKTDEIDMSAIMNDCRKWFPERMAVVMAREFEPLSHARTTSILGVFVLWPRRVGLLTESQCRAKRARVSENADRPPTAAGKASGQMF